MTVDFGWTVPTGHARTPVGGVDTYLPHIRHMIETIEHDFHSLWIPDHFMHDMANVPEAWTTLSYLAGVTTNLFLGTIVLSQSYRNPALLAKMAATLQQLSDGCFILGIGAGWKEDEYQAYGYDYPTASVRLEQMADTIQICRAMWDPTQPEATFSGDHYHILHAVCNPKPDPMPPVLVGGGGEKVTLRIVAEHADWWNLPGVSPAEYAHKIAVLTRHCADIDRDPDEIRKSWMGVVSIASNRNRAEQQMAGYPIWPGDIPLVGTPDEIAAQLQAYVDLGIDLFQLAFADEPSTTGIERFQAEVLPRWSSA